MAKISLDDLKGDVKPKPVHDSESSDEADSDSEYESIEYQASEVVDKMKLLGVKEQKLSKMLEPWIAQDLIPDFILLAKIFKLGK